MHLFISRQQQLAANAISVTSALHAGLSSSLLLCLLPVFHAWMITLLSSDREDPKGRYSIHTLRFVGKQAAYYETDSCDALLGLLFNRIIERQAMRTKDITNLYQ